LQVFYLDIAYVCTVFQVFFICYSKCFRRMFRMFQLFCTYVASVSF
jgi:multidrug transporter EmrE-like cation transporter